MRIYRSAWTKVIALAALLGFAEVPQASAAHGLGGIGRAVSSSKSSRKLRVRLQTSNHEIVLDRQAMVEAAKLLAYHFYEKALDSGKRLGLKWPVRALILRRLKKDAQKTHLFRIMKSELSSRGAQQAQARRPYQ